MTIVRASFDATSLIQRHPLQVPAKQKRALFDLVCPPGAKHEGTIEVARYGALPVEVPYDPSTTLDLKLVRDFFTYERTDADAWYLNFADQNLFFAYGTNLFAQDEIQVAEHPALGALRAAMLMREDLPPLTETSEPTPILIRGVERRAAIDTREIYGWRFARTTDIERYVSLFDPPTRSNIIAIAAPSGGLGRYTSMQITRIIETAYTGFAAARAESERARPGAVVEIHTGFWGCGAFGGNRVLLPMLQIAAAKMAGIDRLVFHARHNAEDFESAKATLDRIADTRLSFDALVMKVHRLGFEWGVSDGN